jgi:hypothetical protein
MLIIGLVSTREEQWEIRSIAQVWIVRERVRYLANQQKNSKNVKKK